MRIHYLFFFLLFIIVGCFFVYNAAHAFFSSAAGNMNNTFTAANVFPTATPSATLTFTPTVSPTPTLGDVVINEIMWTGSSKSASDEWIELRNMTPHAINMSGWVVENLGTSGSPDVIISTSSATIAANGFYLISNFGKNNANSILNVNPDFITPAISLADGGEQLLLKTSTISGTLIDTANQTGSGNNKKWFFPSDSSIKKSMERNTIPGDGTLVGSWHLASSSANLNLGATESATPRTTND